jgi:DNA-binding MarR family transcriptional regulator
MLNATKLQPLQNSLSRADDNPKDHHKQRHINEILSYVEREAFVSQRKIAGEMGVALGLVNTYFKRCVKKGLIKVQQVPSRRYAYYLTPNGFAEKSRLTAEYLSWSLTFFRRARGECAELMALSKRRGWRHVGLVGGSDMAEIAIISAAEQGVTVAALVDAGMSHAKVLGVSVVRQLSDIVPEPDGWIVTDIQDSQKVYDTLVAHAGPSRVLAPAMLSVRLASSENLL